MWLLISFSWNPVTTIIKIQRFLESKQVTFRYRSLAKCASRNSAVVKSPCSSFPVPYQALAGFQCRRKEGRAGGVCPASMSLNTSQNWRLGEWLPRGQIPIFSPSSSPPHMYKELTKCLFFCQSTSLGTSTWLVATELKSYFITRPSLGALNCSRQHVKNRPFTL